MTAALERGEWSAGRPGRTLPLGKTRYPFYRRLDGPQGRSGRAENLVPTGTRSTTTTTTTTTNTNNSNNSVNVNIQILQLAVLLVPFLTRFRLDQFSDL